MASEQPPSFPPQKQADLLALARRIADAIAVAEATPPGVQKRYLVFRVNDTSLALPLTAIREVIVPPPSFSKVPRAPFALLGIMNLRGRVIAVVDLLHTLPAGMVPDKATPDLSSTGRILLLDSGRGEIGLLVHSVEGVADERDGAILARILDPDQVNAAIEALVA